MFIGCMLATLRVSSQIGSMYLGTDFHADLAWFLAFLPSYNGMSFLTHYPLEAASLSVALDTCLTSVGRLCGAEVYHAGVPRWFQYKSRHITHLEIINIVIACKLWKCHWEHQQVTVYCDNLACMQVLQLGRGCDPFLLQCAREIWLLSAWHDFTSVPHHHTGRENVLADCLSHWHLGEVDRLRFWQKADHQSFT